MPSRPAEVHITIALDLTDQLLTYINTEVLLGATNPLACTPGTIRGDYAIVSPHSSQLIQMQHWPGSFQDVGRNVCHGSDSVENAKKEIALWFNEGDLVSYKSSQFDWVYEKP